jgi:ubiquinone/menaquinone biosynthesis C-methylase UbiE
VSIGLIINRKTEDEMPVSSKRSIEQYYAEFPEEERLWSGMGLLELERTKRMLERFMPSPPAVVLDVGGGTGPYSFWLAELGYETHLIDRSERLVQQCRDRVQANAHPRSPRSVEVGDARSLAWRDSSSDAVLMLGPLYHLVERADRVKAIREAHRILRSGGYLFAATISRFASFIAALCEGRLNDKTFVPIVEADLRSGHHRNPTDNISFFTDAFFHRNAEIRGELEEGGFSIASQIPIEGLGCVVRDIEAVWADPTSKEALLNLVAQTDMIDETSGVSFHIMTVGRKA